MPVPVAHDVDQAFRANLVAMLEQVVHECVWNRGVDQRKEGLRFRFIASERPFLEVAPRAGQSGQVRPGQRLLAIELRANPGRESLHVAPGIRQPFHNGVAG